MVYLISQIFQTTARTRHSGMDAGIQSQECETKAGRGCKPNRLAWRP